MNIFHCVPDLINWISLPLLNSTGVESLLMAKIRTDDHFLVPQLPPLLPQPLGSQSHISSDNGAKPATSMATPVSQQSRKPKTKSKSSDDWEARKVKVHQLYMLQDLSLPEVMQMMEREELFVQS